MKPLSEIISSYTNTGIRTFFDLAASMDNVISLGVGEPEYAAAAAAKQAGIDAIKQDRCGYTANPGIFELRQAICDDLEKRWGVKYNPKDEIFATFGASEAIDIALRALINPGDELIIPEPTYVPYVPCTMYAGGVPVTIETSAKTGFCPTLDQIREKITPKTKAIILCYPCNPTGAMAPKELLEGIVKLAIEHDLYIISDEIYWGLSYDLPHTCVPSLEGAWERTILISGFSKSYALTGWRLGYVCAPPHITENMMRIHQFTALNAPTMSQYAALEAIRSGNDHLKTMRHEFDIRRKFFVERINSMGLDCQMPPGAFFAFPSVKATGLSARSFAEKLLAEEQVLVIPGDIFASAEGEANAGYYHIRCNYAVATEKLEEALNRIERFVQRIGTPQASAASSA